MVSILHHDPNDLRHDQSRHQNHDHDRVRGHVHVDHHQNRDHHVHGHVRSRHQSHDHLCRNHHGQNCHDQTMTINQSINQFINQPSKQELVKNTRRQRNEMIGCVKLPVEQSSRLLQLAPLASLALRSLMHNAST